MPLMVLMKDGSFIEVPPEAQLVWGTVEHGEVGMITLPFPATDCLVVRPEGGSMADGRIGDAVIRKARFETRAVTVEIDGPLEKMVKLGEQLARSPVETFQTIPKGLLPG